MVSLTREVFQMYIELLQIQKENIKFEHEAKMEELKFEYSEHQKDHERRMSEIRLKNTNIKQSITMKDKFIREANEKRT